GQWTEDLLLTGNAAIDGIGTVERNTIQGNDADNTLYAYRLNGRSDTYSAPGGFVQQFTAARSAVEEMLHDAANAAIYRGHFPRFAPLQGELSSAFGSDVLIGNGGDDRLFGHFGDVQLVGGDGNDLLYGFAGSDLMRGGAGDD